MWNQWRTGEGTLILLGVLGGWPGAILAQQFFSSQDEEEIIPNRLLVNSAASLLWICAVVVAMDVISQFSSFRQILATDASGNQRQATATVHVQHSRQYCLGVGEQRVGVKWKAK